MLQFLARIGLFLKAILPKAIPIINDFVIPAINIVDYIIAGAHKDEKKFRELLALLIKDPEKVDEVLAAIKEAINNLGVGKKCLDCPTPLETIECFLSSIKSMPKRAKQALYLHLAAEIFKMLSDNRQLSDTDALSLTQFAFELKKSGKLSKGE